MIAEQDDDLCLCQKHHISAAAEVGEIVLTRVDCEEFPIAELASREGPNRAV